MSDNKLSTMLMFGGRAEEAIGLYTSVFDDSAVEFIQRYGADVPGAEGKVAHARFTLNGQPFMAMDSNIEQPFTFTPSMSIFVTCPDAAEVDRLFAALSEGGTIMMALDVYPFAARYAWIQDRFGVSWQLVFSQSA